MRLGIRSGIAFTLGLACGGTVDGMAAPETGAATTSSSTTGSTESGTPSPTTAADFIAQPDGGPVTSCTLYADSCPAGEKCMPYASDGGNRQDATRCVPLAPSPGTVGDPCTVSEFPASGHDDCERGAFCVLYDTTELLGTCAAFCIEDEDRLTTCADPEARCVGGPDVLPQLCSSDCDPFGNDCPGDQACYRIGKHFVCLADVSPGTGQTGDPCVFTNDCPPVSLCANNDEVANCPTSGCCTPLCDTRDPAAGAACPGYPEHECVRIWPVGTGPSLYEWVGACALPTDGGL